MEKKKILIVDDEEDIVFAIRLSLKAKDYEVFVGYNGQEALDKVRLNKPDLIILDLMLPKVDGYKVCRILKFDTKYKNIPVIILTARAQEKDRALAQEVGADDFITKPFESKVLLEKIQKLLGDS